MSSAYLTQALQAMQSASATQQPTVDPAILAEQLKAGKGGLARNLKQAGQNVKATPSRVAGLFDLGAKR